MELKPYQQEVINQLKQFISIRKANGEQNRAAYEDFWKQQGVVPQIGRDIQPYQNRLKNNAPHICIKVPTAGGKTFIACNAIKPLLETRPQGTAQMVVWLVPSNAILEQTARQLKDTEHPYRRKLQALFGSIRVYEKSELLQGQGFQLGQVETQLNILVLSFDSLRAKNKDARKVYQTNGALASFARLVDEEQELSLMAILHKISPVVIIDESHNAATDLSTDMLDQLNPQFVLELTATPRKSSNIVAFVNSHALKLENMVKLPVIVANQKEKNDVITTAIQLREQLETAAATAQLKTGKYIRPIVLFQAQTKNAKGSKGEDPTTFGKVKDALIKIGIPANQIKIKTATINELQGIDLMSPDCEVRYIITINALQEGWDCPFAYVLASLADKTSTVDVTQILGRILRQPYVSRHQEAALNLSYVITASNKFMDTLTHIVESLKKVGFGDKDYRQQDQSQTTDSAAISGQQAQTLLFGSNNSPQIETDTDQILTPAQVEQIQQVLAQNIGDKATTLSQTVQEIIAQTQTVEKEQSAEKETIATEIKAMQKTYTIKSHFLPLVEEQRLPQFVQRTASGLLVEETTQMLEGENLLLDFKLSNQNKDIDFDAVDSTIYQIDVNSTENNYYQLVRQQLNQQAQEYLSAYMMSERRREEKIKQATDMCLKELGNMRPISEKELQKYVTAIISDFDTDRMKAFVENLHSYTKKIKAKIEQLSEIHRQKVFTEWLDKDKILLQDTYSFPLQIHPTKTIDSISKSLYEKEGDINGLEEKVIMKVADLQNVDFWTRNDSRKGFRINGFINHYPDFIIKTKKGKWVILETKGEHLDANDKIRLGKLWESKTGGRCRYFLVYEDKEVADAYKLDDFIDILKYL